MLTSISPECYIIGKLDDQAFRVNPDSRFEKHPMSKTSARIGYILQMYPGLTMTFIYREVLALRRRGVGIDIFSVWKPKKDRISPESRPLMEGTYYLFPRSWFRFLSAHFSFFVSHPWRYISTAIFVMTRKGERMKNRLRTSFHFGEAVVIAREVEQRNIRHLHAHFSRNAASIAFIIARLLGISFSFTGHNDFFTDRILLKEKVQEARFVAVISEFSRRYLLDLCPGPAGLGKTHLVRCGIFPGQFPPRVLPVNKVPQILFLGQLAERKGAVVLIESCRNLAERGTKFRCIIAGDGPERDSVERLASRYGLKDSVAMVGGVFQEQAREWLSSTDIFVLPCIKTAQGDMDGIPVVLMEAMACEVPVVSTRISGIPELIEDGDSGFLVEENDAAALADALQLLIADKDLRLRLGKSGRQKVLREFDIDQSASRLAELLERSLQADLP